VECLLVLLEVDLHGVARGAKLHVVSDGYTHIEKAGEHYADQEYQADDD
jgi:hypothetical protein